MRDRVLGVLLFLPVPAVLALFTQAPLGPVLSLLAGVALTGTHRFYARPFARARAQARCLWCGGAAPGGPELTVQEPGGITRWRACGAGHAARVRRLLGWAGRHAALVRLGILGSLGAYLLLTVAAIVRPAGAIRVEDAANVFRLGVAATVLPLALLGPRSAPAPGPLRSPFPVHVQALIGSAAVVWLFRIVGLAWLALSLAHFLR